MADYTPIDPNSLLPGQPITSALGQALEENPRAQQDFAAGAPINVGIWHPFDADEYGESDGLLYDHAVDGEVSSVETPVFDAGYEYKMVFEDMRRTSFASSLLPEARLTATSSYLGSPFPSIDDTGATFARRASGQFFVFRPFLVAHALFFRLMYVVGGPSWSNEINPSDRTGFVNVAVTRSTATAVDRMRLRAGAGNFNSGKVWLMRRKVEGF